MVPILIGHCLDQAQDLYAELDEDFVRGCVVDTLKSSCTYLNYPDYLYILLEAL